MAQGRWFVYMLEAADGTLYTGITTDPERRFREHSSGGQRAAKYFKARTARKIVYLEHQPDRSHASQREAAIKKLKRREKLALIRQDKSVEC